MANSPIPIPIVAEALANGFEFPQLTSENRAGELIHAKVARGERAKQPAAQCLGIGRVQRAEVVKPESAFEKLRIAGDHGPALARGDGSEELAIGYCAPKQ